MPLVGDQKTGDVWVRDFDTGVITTMGGQLLGWSQDGNNQQNYIIPLGDIAGLGSSDLPVDSTGTTAPGIPITFTNPKATVENHVLPSIEVQRNGEPVLALGRWPSLGLQYKRPADGANPVVITKPDGTTLNGYDSYETKVMAWPYDINYTIIIRSKYRRVTQAILKKVLRTYQPYSLVNVKDSLDEDRTYDVYLEGFSDISEFAEIGNRLAVWSVTIRVEGQIDLNDPVVYKAVKEGKHNMHQKE
jgi:hypothetical protein